MKTITQSLIISASTHCTWRFEKSFKSTTPEQLTRHVSYAPGGQKYPLSFTSVQPHSAEEKQLPLGDDTTDQVVTNRWGPQPASQFKNSYNNFLFVRPIYNLRPLSFDRHPPHPPLDIPIVMFILCSAWNNLWNSEASETKKMVLTKTIRDPSVFFKNNENITNKTLG